MNTPNARLSRWPALFTLSTLLTVLTLFAVAPPARAADANPPSKMTFQGFLTDASNPPVPLGNTSPVNKEVTFRIYDNATAGAVKWAETQIVTLDKGHFSVLLGEGAAVSGQPHADLHTVFVGADASDRWLGITVDGAEITPRIQFFAAPYAQLARAANSLVSSSGANLVATTGGNVGIGTTSPRAKLEVDGTIILRGAAGGNSWSDQRLLWGGDGTGYALTLGSINNNGTFTGPALTVLDNGKVGIGTTSPQRTLHLQGAGGMRIANGANGFEILESSASNWQFTGIGSVTSLSFIGANVGIGTATPNGGLDVVGGNGGTTRFQLFGEGGGTFSYYVLRSRNANDSAYADTVIRTDDFVIETGTTGATTQRFRITDSGNVGIGTTTPSAKLHLSGNMKIEGANTLEFGAGVAGKEPNAGKIGYQTFSPNVNNGSYMLDIVGAGYTGINGSTRYVKVWDALYITGWASSPSFNTSSDGRIKRITGRPDGESSLENIRRLQVTDFSYVDTALHGRATKRGLIAQEVEKVFPDAVKQTTDFVPDIYAPAIDSQFDAVGKTLMIDLKDPHGLNLGDMVRLNLDNDQKALKVVGVPSPTRFVVEMESDPGKVFVFGKQVNDFRTVDYDHVFTTGISAIQELDRQVQALKKSEARIAELEQKTARMAELEQKAARVDSLEREMAELKKLVAGLAQGKAPGRLTAQNIPTAARQ